MMEYLFLLYEVCEMSEGTIGDTEAVVINEYQVLEHLWGSEGMICGFI